jgi:hypothetical protein
VPPFTSIITVSTFLFEAKSISEVEVIEVETVDSVPLLLTDTVFDGGEGSLSFSSLNYEQYQPNY